MKVTLLGTGTSHGVPAIGCACEVCRSADPRDRRLRPSILIETGGLHVLVDTSTDLRAQALSCDLRRVDAILYTHSHADHVLGLDDVRRFNALQRTAIPVYADAPTLEALRRMFAYIFSPPEDYAGAVAQLAASRIVGPFTLGGAEFVPVPLYHGRRLILGFRAGDFAYLTDCNRIPDASWPLLDGVKVLVLDALRERPHPTHFSLGEALEAVARIAPERAYFTHVCHDLPHASTCARLPRGVELGYDGLVLEIA
ncbi:MAG: MBL fold metallo-hydrolase [Acidobacteria bacterium]|nr:MBL fold metallo-hydrolase [Acidobacteriota bacterium]